ncbi:MAG: hypothetical protein E7371_03560 [Clostridiales bacterium]|nr:hypothetical protein [Clostridiales bacterium]
MANQEVNNTILTEHRRIVGSRHFLALINFLAILLGTGITLFFVIKRGSPPIMQTYLYILIGINLAQIGLCLADYILKTKCGIYRKELPIISYAVGGLWLVLLIVELITGTLEYNVLRVDFLLLTCIQVVVALIAYLVWPNMDRRAIDAMIQSKVKSNPAKRNSISKRFVLLYALLSLFVVMAQAGSLLVYKVSPRLYDLFAESRAVKYELTEDGEGYVVAYVYVGTSPYVNIPAMYNNKPVVGLKKGALVDDGLLAKNKIATITFGTPSGDGSVVSNLKFIENGAISNNNIQTLSIPETVSRIEAGAIVSTSLQNIEYAAKAEFNAQCIAGCTALENILMSGDKVGAIVSLDGLNENTTIKVAQEDYNTYRKANFNYASNFSPVLEEGQICLDFYSDCDYYIDSIIKPSGESISLSLTDFETVGIAKDMKAYIADEHEVGTEGAKAASAFRGWYYDAAFTNPCVFTEDGAVSIAKSATLYAKWITEYTGTLNWGTYQPEGTDSYAYWTEEDVVATFPLYTDLRDGYAGGVQWRISGNEDVVYNSEGCVSDITLDATWILDKPVIDITSNLNGEVLQELEGKDMVSFTYDENNTLWLNASHTHDLDGKTYEGNTFSYAYYWTKVDSTRTSEVDRIDLDRVSDSGTYQLQVTANSPYGETSSATTTIDVTVHKKAIPMDDTPLADATKEYNGQAQTVAYADSIETKKVQVTYTYADMNGVVLSTNSGVMPVGEYVVTALVEKENATDAENYKTHTEEAILTITKRSLTWEGWAGNGTGWTDNTIVYDGQTKSYTMQVGGILAGDTVELVYADDSQYMGLKNAGTYTAKVTGITNPNYKFADDLTTDKLEATWEITPKEVFVNKWQVNGSDWIDKTIVYDGAEHSIYAVLDGYVSGDTVGFNYDPTSDFSNKATNAGQYKAKIIGVNNPNYTFDTSEENASATCEWSITPRALKVEFDNPTLTYNGADQGVTATISNFAAKDFDSFKQEMFAFAKSADVAVGYNALPAGIQVTYKAVNAGDYSASVDGLNTSVNAALLQNYTLTETTKDFTIAQRELLVQKVNASYTYNGAEQAFKVNVTQILSKDLSGFELGQFGISASPNTSETIEGKGSGVNYELVFKGKNAGDYNLSIASFNSTNDTTKNYKLKESYTTTFTIAKKALSIDKWQLTDKKNDTSKEFGLLAELTHEYNYFGYTVTPIFSGVITGETVALTLENSKQTQAGTYTTKASLDETAYPNYSLTETTTKWHIKPLEIDVVWTVDGEAITADTNLIYDGHEWTVVPTYQLLEDDTLTLTYNNTANLKQTNKGDYALKITNTENVNYTLKNPECTWKINAKDVTLTWKPLDSYTYTGGYQGPQFTLNGVAEADVDKIALTAYTRYNGGAAARTQSVAITSHEATQVYKFAVDANSGFALDAGTHKIEGLKFYKNGVADNNYNISNTYEYTIAKKTLTLTGVWNYTNTLGNGEYNEFTADQVVYNKNNYTLTTAIADGIVDRLNDGVADEVELGYSNNRKSGAGDYTAKVTSLTGAQAKNYQLPTVNVECDWSIAPKVLVLSWSDADKVYSGFEQTQNATITNACDGDIIKLTYAQNHKATDAGNYTVNVTAIDNTNYTITGTANLTFNWTIKPMPIALTWNTDNFTYNKTAQYPTAYYMSDKDGKISVTEYANTNAVAVTQNINAGTYTVQAKKLDNANYIIDESADKHLKEYTIKPFELTLTWFADGFADFDLTYNRQERTITATANTFGDDVVTLVYANNKFTNAGTYTVTVGTALENDNYVLIHNTKSVTVNPKLVTFAWTWDDEGMQGGNVPTFTYDGNPHTLEASAVGVIAGDTVTVNYAQATTSFTNKGTHTVTVNWISNNNYTFVEESNTLTIHPQKVKVTWTGETALTYDGNEHTLTASIVGADDGKTLAFSYDTNGYTFKKADTHTVTISKLTDTNYTLDGAVGGISKDLVIAKKVVEISWSGLENTYYKNGTYTAKPTITNVCLGDTVTVNSYSAEKESAYGAITNNSNSTTSAGEYKITATGLSNANYTLEGATDTEVTLSVAKQKVTIEWNSNADLVYNGNTRTLTAVVKGADDSVNISTSVNYEVTKDDAEATCKTVGTYKFTITGLQNDNYTFEGTGEQLWETLTITPRVVTLNWSTYTGYYNGENHTATATVTNRVTSDTVNLTYSGERTFKDAGTYTVSVVALDNDNYTLTGGTNLSTDLIINQRPVTLNWTTYSGIYDGAEHTATAGITNLVAGDVVSLKYSTNTYKNKGTYTVSVEALEGLDNSNYTLTGGTNLSTNLIINQRPVTLSWSTYSGVYDGAEHTATAGITNLVGGDTVNLTYNGERTLKNVGERTVSVVALDNDNYTLTDVTNTSTTLKITQRAVTLNWTTYLDIYDGAEHTATATVANLVEGDTVNLTYSENTLKNVGELTVNVVALDNGNYTLTGGTNLSTNLKITQRAVTLTWTTESGEYDGEQHSATATLGNVVDGDTVNLTYDGQNTFTNAGVYTVKADSLGNTNYTLAGVANLEATLIITPQKVKITWGTNEFVYDGNAKNLTATVKGANDGQPVGFTLANNGQTNAGSYVVTVVLNNSNYTLDGVTNATETLTINKAVATIAWSNTECVYDGNAHLPTVTVTGVNGETLNYVLSATGFTAVDTYTVEVVSLANANYTLDGANKRATFTITAPVEPPVQA